MNAAQIAALSQIQAQAIVNARPQTALVGKSGEDDETPTTTQIQNQILDLLFLVELFLLFQFYITLYR